MGAVASDFFATCALMKHGLFMLFLARGQRLLKILTEFYKVQPLIPLFDGGAVAFLLVLRRIAVFLVLHLLRNGDCFIITVCRYKQKEKTNNQKNTRKLEKLRPSALCFLSRGPPLIFMAMGKGESKAAPPFFYGA